MFFGAVLCSLFYKLRTGLEVRFKIKVCAIHRVSSYPSFEKVSSPSPWKRTDVFEQFREPNQKDRIGIAVIPRAKFRETFEIKRKSNVRDYVENRILDLPSNAFLYFGHFSNSRCVLHLDRVWSKDWKWRGIFTFLYQYGFERYLILSLMPWK